MIVLNVMLACMTRLAKFIFLAPRACATTTEQPTLRKLKMVINRSII